MDLNDRILLIRNDSTDISEFIEEYKPFIAACASGVVKRFLYYGEDDELSIGLSAFYEAIMAYEKDKGAFLSFARGVIQRRVIDYLRKQRKHAESLFIDKNGEEWRVMEYEASMSRYESGIEENELKREIQALEEDLSEYGIKFADMLKLCPKHNKLIKQIQKTAHIFVNNEELYMNFRQNKRLPIIELSKISQIPQKKIERFRKYIIVVSIIIYGGYERLKEYIKG